MFYRVTCSCILLIMLATFNVSAQEWVTELSPKYQTYLVRMAADAEAVQQQLLANPPSKEADKVEVAQYYYSLSTSYYQLSYPQKALEYARKALDEIKGQQQPWLQHKVRLCESLALDIVGTPSKGMLGANAAILWSELVGDQLLLVNALYVRGSLLNSMVDYVGALSDLQKAYELAPEDAPFISKGLVAGSLALVYEYRDEYALSVPYFEEAAVYQRRQQNWIELSIALYGLGRANKNIGNSELGREQLQESMALAEQVNDFQGVVYALKELATMDIEQKDYLEAERKLLRAQDIFSRSQHRQQQFGVALALVRLSRLQKLPEQAQLYLAQAAEKVDPVNMPLQYISYQEEEAAVKADRNEFEEAYTILNNTIEKRRLTMSSQSTEQLHQLRSRYELEVKERENTLLEKENQLQKANLAAQSQRNIQLRMLATFAALLCLLLFILVYHTKKHRSRLERLANVDGLTGLFNRRKTLEVLDMQVELASRHEFDLTVAMVDLDHFKQINDKYGHATGDEVLEAFAAMCNKSFRNTDIVGRVGGEEFLIAFPHTSAAAARIALEELRMKIQKIPENMNVTGLTLSMSSGICQFKRPMSASELMGYADEALYIAKDSGRNRVKVAEVCLGSNNVA